MWTWKFELKKEKKIMWTIVLFFVQVDKQGVQNRSS